MASGTVAEAAAAMGGTRGRGRSGGALERRHARLAQGAPAASCSSPCPASTSTATSSSPTPWRGARRLRRGRARRGGAGARRGDPRSATPPRRSMRSPAGCATRLPEHVVGITGSTGKTTTKELTAALLATRYRVARSPGNLNNLLGFPLALLGTPDDTEWLVAEMGMSSPGELAGISRLGRPDVRDLHQRAAGSPRAARQPGGDRSCQVGASRGARRRRSGGRQRR